MPTYVLRNTETGEEKEVFMSWSRLSDYLSKNPEWEQKITMPNVISNTEMKIPSAFRDEVSRIANDYTVNNIDPVFKN